MAVTSHLIRLPTALDNHEGSRIFCSVINDFAKNYRTGLERWQFQG
jgi:hypothetical protein